MNNNDIQYFHILHNYKDNTWNIKIGDAQESIMTSANKEACIEKAKALAKQSTTKKRKVVVHGTSGRFQEGFYFE